MLKIVLQMLQLRLDGGNRKILTLMISMFISYNLLFLSNMFTFRILILPIKDEIAASTNDIFKPLMFTLNILFFQGYIVMYMMIIYLTYSRLSLIRRYFETFINDRKSAPKEVVESLMRISVFMDRICDTLDLMKICYTTGLVFYLTHFTFQSVISIYGFISYYFASHSGYYDLGNSSVTMTWEIFYAPAFFWIFIFANLIKKEGKKLSKLTRTILLNKYHEKINKRMKLMNMQLLHREMHIESAFYVIDWKLLFFIIGEVFSYLVIVVQFEFKSI